MREINDVSIAVLLLGLLLIIVTIFLGLVGVQANLKKRLTQCGFGTMYVVVLVTLAICKEESHWVEGRASDVQIRVWAFDNTDSKADIGVHLGLRGVNITLMVKDRVGLMFNERFEWAWGTKNSMEDKSNPFKRTLTQAVDQGIPLPVQELAESFATYGTMGSASPGIGVHEAGFYTDLCLTIALGTWVFVGLLPPLSLYGCFYASFATTIALLVGLLTYILMYFSWAVPSKSKKFYQKWNEDQKVSFSLRFTWCFYMYMLMIIVTAFLSWITRRYAQNVALKQLLKMQQELELEETEKRQTLRREDTVGSNDSAGRSKHKMDIKRAFQTKRRLTATFSAKTAEIINTHAPVCKEGTKMKIVPLSEVEEVGTSSTCNTYTFPGDVHRQGLAVKAQDVRSCDAEYKGPTTPVYSRATEDTDLLEEIVENPYTGEESIV